VRASDKKGRHTTTWRELVLLPGGGLLIDTPGMREIQLLDADEGVQDAFADVDALAAECEFRDCTHGPEPGCAVKRAVAAGTLSQDRLASYHKLTAEIGYQTLRGDKRAQAAKKAADRMSNKALSKRLKDKQDPHR
jgi:ribosome biogenesis GTPase